MKLGKHISINVIRPELFLFDVMYEDNESLLKAFEQDLLNLKNHVNFNRISFKRVSCHDNDTYYISNFINRMDSYDELFRNIKAKIYCADSSSLIYNVLIRMLDTELLVKIKEDFNDKKFKLCDEKLSNDYLKNHIEKPSSWNLYEIFYQDPDLHRIMKYFSKEGLFELVWNDLDELIKKFNKFAETEPPARFLTREESKDPILLKKNNTKCLIQSQKSPESCSLCFQLFKKNIIKIAFKLELECCIMFSVDYDSVRSLYSAKNIQDVI
jgi:hypothetical protein